MACVWDGFYLEGLQTSLHLLPLDTRDVLLHGSNCEFLDALATLALDPKWTACILVAYEPLMVDICNRWLSGRLQVASRLKVVAALASIMPFAPQLSLYTEEAVFRWKYCHAQSVMPEEELNLLNMSDAQLLCFLLALTRLLEYNNATYAPIVHPSKMQHLLSHGTASVRYLAVKILCLYLHTSDKAFNEMRQRFVRDVEVPGSWDAVTIDYLFYPAWEIRRRKTTHDGLCQRRTTRFEPFQVPPQSARLLETKDFSPSTLTIANILLPHVGQNAREHLNLVLSDGTTRSIRAVVSSIISPKPTLVVGPPGSGKSSIIKDIARVLCQESKMLTLHLNEQTDAKYLIGLHTASGMLGSFSWQPGVLTKAVQEGRWVLIEDIDHAPRDVMSLLLPLVERNELLVPNLGGYIRAARGFKLLATVRIDYISSPKFSHLSQNLLETDSWHQVKLESLRDSDIQEIISVKHPVLLEYQPMIMAVHRNLRSLKLGSFDGRNTIEIFQITQGVTNLFRFCRRLETLLKEAGVTSGREPISESVHDCMFLEAVDSFVSGIQSNESRRELIELIAQHIQVSPTRVRYCIMSRTPKLVDGTTICSVGRVSLQKCQTPQLPKPLRRGRPFVRTKHAIRSCESIAAAVKMREPCLLVGETGTGKTTLVQELASLLGNTLTVINLSQQSEASDLLGGFKPLSLRALAAPIKDDFELLFNETFPSHENQRFLTAVDQAVVRKEWNRLAKLLQGVLERVDNALNSRKRKQESSEEIEPPRKRNKTSTKLDDLTERWKILRENLHIFQQSIEHGSKGFAFYFLEGNLVKAVREGAWVLLDEINLASPDVLESLTDLFSNDADGPFILLSETGKIERIKAHPNFRIFGAMNPASNVGKRDLPPAIRSRFMELHIESPDRDIDSLIQIVSSYLGDLLHGDRHAAQDVGNLYLGIKTLEGTNSLVDGAGQMPHFSLRTLTRTLVYVTEIASTYGLRRALFEGFAMSFLTVLNEESKNAVVPLIEKGLFGQGDSKPLRLQVPRIPNDGRSYIRFKHHWIPKGPFDVKEQPQYIVTPFVGRNLLNLVRATSARKYPVLLQGPTSSGKTSMVEYLASISGNKCVRINNHEHTDLQEYLGSYVSEESGRIVYREGVLVHALRQGYWVILDELNLASSDILEALNRLLDDNRELLIPETQEVVRPHENFMLFATQNPPGLYGGRKALSRAFRNRFLELHFSDIPEQELETILRERTQIAPSFCSKIVSVYKKLAILRQSERLFEQEQSFVTLRDLFRWANRKAENREELAIHGFMILGERVRNIEERLTVKRVIQDVIKTKVDEERLYNVSSAVQASSTFVWTASMCRLFVLVTEAMRRNEPILLIGETGTGKTAVCQAIAQSMYTRLHTLNAHQNTETGDLIGAQRPIRNRSQLEDLLYRDMKTMFTHFLHRNDAAFNRSSMIRVYQSLSQSELDLLPFETRRRIDEYISKINALFEWSNSNLVQAMMNGEHFLLDEISLADDAVLERLNSILEPSRTLFLAEKGGGEAVTAIQGFQFLATMNPSGDYGKRELSPALRNRFTEIWVPRLSMGPDVRKIVEAKLAPTVAEFAEPMVMFSLWFSETYNGSLFSLRQILTWVDFMNFLPFSDPFLSTVHGAAMVFIDGLGANPSGKVSLVQSSIITERLKCLLKLSQLFDRDLTSLYFEKGIVEVRNRSLCIGPFQLARYPHSYQDITFNLNTPTSFANTLRIARALHLGKPLLIEGSPGVGKTTLVKVLAQLVGIPLTRINLSEQTDIMDLFGSDVPAEDAAPGRFVWRDAPFLQAMQRGEWVLLDEMNLASQAVLEGLNACLDHRGQVYIPELDQTFSRHPSFMVFAAQNPHSHGNSRKGLPASFVNRFTVVYADLLTDEDLRLICTQLYPKREKASINSLIGFISEFNRNVGKQQSIFNIAGFVEYNLRDLLRWLQLMTSENTAGLGGDATDFVDMLFLHKLRVDQEFINISRLEMRQQLMLEQRAYHTRFIHLSPSAFQVGLALVDRHAMSSQISPDLLPLRNKPEGHNLALLESLMIGVQHKWPCLLVGQKDSGKLATLTILAHKIGAFLMELPMNSDMDTMDLIGGYEQTDLSRRSIHFINKVGETARRLIAEHVSSSSDVKHILPTFAIVEWCTLSGPKDLHVLRRLLDEARDGSAREITYARLLDECSGLLKEQSKVGQVHFEWVDGVLVRALQEGHWIVLRDANFCNSSVLDRLNALMEPGGTLAITENRLPDGTHRVIQPHPKFRLFLTTDPKYGELSRAMRNRCVELYFPPVKFVLTSPLYTSSDSLLFRYLNFQNIDWNSLKATHVRGVLLVCLDHLSFSDIKIYQQFGEQLRSGLLSLDATKLELFSDVWSLFSRVLSENSLICSAIKKLYQSLVVTLPTLEDVLSTQPIHPLNNTSFTMSSSARLERKTLWIASLFDAAVDLSCLRHDMDGPMGLAEVVTRTSTLHRSSNLRNVDSHVTSMTRSVMSFIRQFGDGIQDWLNFLASFPAVHSEFLSQLGEALDFLDDIFRNIVCKSWDEGAFRVYLEIGSSISERIESTNLPHQLRAKLVSTLQNFESPWILSTGLSMNRLWDEFRPLTVATSTQLASVLQLESIANRFDNAVARLHAIGNVVYDLRNSLRQILSQLLARKEVAENSIMNLIEPLEAIEREILYLSTNGRCKFEEDFEGLCQASQHRFELTRTELSLLEPFAHRATLSMDGLGGHSSGARLLAQIQQYTGIGMSAKELILQRKALPISLLANLRSILDVPLQRLEYLQQEVRLLQNSANSLCIALDADPFDALLKLLGKLCQHVLISHQDLFEPKSFSACLEYLEEYPLNVWNGADRPLPPVFGTSYKSGYGASKFCRVQDVFEETMFPSLEKLHKAAMKTQTKRTGCALAWITFFTGCLRLYLPNQVYDPASQRIVSQSRFKQKQQRLQQKLNAIKAFDVAWCTGNPSFRYQLIEKELNELGNIPEIDHVFRPEIPDFDDLQIEFSTILESIVESVKSLVLPTSLDMEPMKRDAILLLRQNIDRSIRRLSNSNRAYDDIGKIVVGFLRGLDVGLSLCLLEDICKNQTRRTTDTIIQLTPLLGLTSSFLINFEVPAIEVNPVVNIDNRIRYLQLASLAIVVDCQASQTLISKVLKIFHSYFNDWKRQLQSDKFKSSANSSLYQYRGQKDDNDSLDPQEYPELFPEVDQAESMETDAESLASNLKTLSSQEVAAFHQKIFVQKSRPSSMILAMVRQSSDDIAALWQDSDDFTVIPVDMVDMLPGVLLCLDRASEEVLPQSTQNQTYNFYTDSNVNEAQKLIELLKRIYLRFRDIQSVWPEHATLNEILKVSSEMMDSPFREVVAKKLIRAEQLHKFMYEWQMVASRDYTASGVYNELTALLVNWRQLELSAWAGLLESEDLKCRKDAKSWWFLAYEVTIAAPLEVIGSENDLEAHVRGMTKSLCEFLTSTPLGQYQERLEILKRFRDHARFLIIEHPSMHLVSTALTNVVRYYGRYTSVIRDSLAKDRSSLEKDVKEVILLATWKDTNITALRESSRRSRAKLLKVVRKYRMLLAQPVNPILNLGLPEVKEDPGDVILLPNYKDIPLLPEASQMCAEKLATWRFKPARFTQARSTAEKLAQICTPPATSIDASSHLNSWLLGLTESVKSLRKETPAEATDDNKAIVKNLKSQKRRLLADTLKALRLMGFRSNPGSQLLEKQATLHAILANSPSLYSQTFDTDYAEHCFDKALDNISAVRNVATTHHEDLTSQISSQCLGYLESILSTTLNQRNLLATSFRSIDKLDGALTIMSGLWKSDFEELQRNEDSDTGSQLKHQVRWLIHLIEATCEIITKHDRMAIADTSSTITTLNDWKEIFKSLAASAEEPEFLPPGLSARHHRSIKGRMLETLRKFDKLVEEEEVNNPPMRFIMRKLRLWTKEPKASPNTQNLFHPLDPSVLDQGLSDLIDSMLANAQEVQDSLSKHPILSDQMNWLVETDGVIGKSLRLLRTKATAVNLEHLSNIMQSISQEGSGGLRLAAAMCTVPAPILYQYLDTAKDIARRYLMLHQTCCNMLRSLTTIYKHIATDGFCSPRAKTGTSDEKAEKLEEGAGLGEGKGAEDISKDVGDDEDLSELAAQNVSREDEQEKMRAEDDAVDMQHDELEGEMSDDPRGESQDDQNAEDGDDADADMDEETGSVNDLDQNAIDEKLWDEAGSLNKKRKQTDTRRGEKEDEVTAQDGADEAREEENQSDSEANEDEGADEGEQVNHQELDEAEPQAERETHLDLPDQMDIDGKDEPVTDSEGDITDPLSDAEQGESESQDGELETVGADLSDASRAGNEDPQGNDVDNADLSDEILEDSEDKDAEEDRDRMLQKADIQLGQGDAEPNQNQGGVMGSGEQEECGERQGLGINDQTGQDTELKLGEQIQNAAQSGQQGRGEGQVEHNVQNSEPEQQEGRLDRAFRKLGNAFEKWHRQNRQPQSAQESERDGKTNIDIDAAMDVLEHLPDENAVSDAQALGAATEEEAHALDKRALEAEVSNDEASFLPDDASSPKRDNIENHMDGIEAPKADSTDRNPASRPVSTFLNNQQNYLSQHQGTRRAEDEVDVSDIDTNLSTVQLDPSLSSLPRSVAEARQLWTCYEALTRELSLVLTEQLRLILAPTLATKMRGDFRTGKRLNIKRIIPYIASGYKRDKIWMRRSIPSKRSYQIMLAVDDSKSMGSSGSDELAFETLALVSKSLSMLEVGQICIVGFGDEVRVAHEFDQTFSSEAGANVFQHFGFKQTKTNVKSLMTESIKLFREARAKAFTTAVDLWQLELIISDGVCEDHEGIRRLVRQAHDERIMVVFVIVDGIKGESIMDMTRAEFEDDESEGGSKVKIRRYLEGFPFGYYLIVGHVKELPRVLATALRQWFAEVAESS